MDCYASWWLSSFFFFFFLCSSRVDYCYARDTLKYGEWIIDNGTTTLVSSGGRFELGFFTPINTSSHERYVGIWYKQDQQTVVWVANGDNPVPNGSTGTFGIEDGNLKVWDNTTGIDYSWVTNLDSSSTYRTVKLMDSGNLVVSDIDDDQSATSLWESFKYPTDTFLPGMLMDGSLKLLSWKLDRDREQARFMFEQDQEDGNYVISKYQNDSSVNYWRSSWIRGSSDEMPDDILNLLSNRSNSRNYSYERLVMNYTGELQYYRSSGVDQLGNWSLIWRKPEDKYCSIYNFCGNFGSCNINNRPFVCKCLPGFHPTNPGDWDSFNDFSGGCTRNSINSTHEIRDISFLSLNMMKVGNPPDFTYVLENCSDTNCRRICLNLYSYRCQAYSYRCINDDGNMDSDCRIWTSDPLSDLEEEYTGGRNLFVRVAKSVIESSPRNCTPCGTNLIPYPLSTKPNCGDPMYFNFSCNSSTGQVHFNRTNGTYRVVSINPSTRKFVIQAKNAGNFQLSERFSFNDSGNYSFKAIDEIEISWKPPLLEPSCNSLNNCKDLPNSTCNVARDGKRRCLCNRNFYWNGSNLNCTEG